MSKIPVGILGATGAVGQRFVSLLSDHPWFEIAEVVASERSAGKSYGKACTWRLPAPPPPSVASLEVKGLGASLSSPLLFSGLDSEVAGEAETGLAEKGHAVVTNSRNHRMDRDVPLLIPEVNADHLELLAVQRRRTKGFIVTNPNCSVVGLALALAPFERAFGLEEVVVVTLQALSGAGYPGVASLDIADNVVPYIAGGEEEKIETEPRKILGQLSGEEVSLAHFKVSASVHRVGVSEGHTLAAFVRLKTKPSLDVLKTALASFRGEPQERRLPSAPERPIHVLEDQDRPQPRLDRDREAGMAISVGRLRQDGLSNVKLEILVHNTIRGGAGAAILNAELLKARGLLP